MYSGGNYKDGNILYLGNMFYISPIFDSLTKYVNASITRSESFTSRRGGLEKYFGINARQDDDYLYVKKTDLSGIVPSSSNTAESLLVAIILLILGSFNEEDDPIIARIFDVYVSGNLIKHTILIEATYKATIIDNEIQNSLDSIDPKNYDNLL